MYRAERQISTLDLPHLHRFEPVVRLQARVVSVVGLGTVYYMLSQKLGMCLQILVGET